MKKLAILFFLLPLVTLAQTNTINVTYRFADFQLLVQPGFRTVFTPLQPFADYTGAILSPVPKNLVTDTNGTVVYSNTVPGYSYRIELDTPYGSTIRTSSFPTSLSGNVNGRDYLANIKFNQVYYQYLNGTNGAPGFATLTDATNIAIANQTPWSADINANVHNLTNVNNLTISGALAFPGTVTNSVNAPSVGAGTMSAGSFIGGAFNGTGANITGINAANVSGDGHNMTNVNGWNPLQFGAVGNGVANDTAALLACVQAASTNAVRKIDLQGLAYVTTTPLVLTNTDMIIQNGMLITTQNTNIVKMANDRQVLRDLRLAGPSSPGNTNSVAVWIENVNGPYIQEPHLLNVKATNFWYGVYGNLTVHTEISHCQITACMGTNIWLHSCDQTVIRNSTVGMNYGANIDIQDSGLLPNLAGGQHPESNTVAIYIFGGIGTSIERCDSAFFRQWVVCDSSALTVQNCNLENCFGVTNTGAIDITNSPQVTILKCNFFNGQGVLPANAMTAVWLRMCGLSGCIIDQLSLNGFSWAVDVLGAQASDPLNAPWILQQNLNWRINWVAFTRTTAANVFGPAIFANWNGADNGDVIIGQDTDRTKCELFNTSGTLELVSPGSVITFQNGSSTTLANIGSVYMQSGRFVDLAGTRLFDLINTGTSGLLNFGRNSGNSVPGIQGSATDTTGTMDSSVLNTAAGTWTLNTNLVTRGSTTATNGFASYSASTATVNATGYTNTMTIGGQAVNVEVIFSGGTSVLLKDASQTTRHTYTSGPTNASVILKPGWGVTGTAMSGDVISQ